MSQFPRGTDELSPDSAISKVGMSKIEDGVDGMRQPSFRPSYEPTIWALRRNVRATKQNNTPQTTPTDTLYEHLFGYDPIRVMKDRERFEDIHKGSAENPQLNIINPVTNFTVMELASEEEPSKA